MPTINPYALQFGQEPQQLIPRESQLSEVVANFLSDNGLQHIYMITGIRGSGKTVFMTNVANSFVSKQWIVINVNVSSQISIVEQIVIQLANNKRLKNSFCCLLFQQIFLVRTSKWTMLFQPLLLSTKQQSF